MSETVSFLIPGTKLKTYKGNEKLFYERNRKHYDQRKQERPWATCVSGVKSRAKERRFEFNLSEDWCKTTYTGYCAVTGIRFILGHKMFGQSIDRVDSSKGYTTDNCRFVLIAVNQMKSNGSDEEVLLVAQAIIKPKKFSPIDFSQTIIYKAWGKKTKQEKRYKPKYVVNKKVKKEVSVNQNLHNLVNSI